jgi:hypothetical protein
VLQKASLEAATTTLDAQTAALQPTTAGTGSRPCCRGQRERVVAAQLAQERKVRVGARGAQREVRVGPVRGVHGALSCALRLKLDSSSSVASDVLTMVRRPSAVAGRCTSVLNGLSAAWATLP